MLTKIGDVLEKLILAVVALLMGVMIVATVIAVVQRYVVGSAFNWAEEFCGYDMVWCAFLGAAVAFRHHDLVLLDLFTRMLPQEIRKAVRLITHVICLVLIAYLAYTSLRYSLSPSIFMRRCTTLPFTMFVPFVSVPIGLFVMFLFGLENLPAILSDIVGRDDTKTKEGA